MVTDRNTLKGWFVKGAKPLAVQFATWIDSFWHKDDSIPVGNIDGLQSLVDGLATQETVDALARSITEIGDKQDRLLTGSITVNLSSGKTLGKYASGAVIPLAGKTITQVLTDLAVEYISPAFTAFTKSIADTVEVGATVSGSVTFTWVMAINSGAISSIKIFDNTGGTVLVAGLSNDGSEIVTVTTKQLNSENATQSWKAIAIDSGNSNAEVSSPNAVVTAKFRRYWGAVASIPTNRTEALALTNGFHNSTSITLVTGTTYNTFVVLLPPGKTITSVIDTTNLSLDITANYVLVGTVSIADAGGTARTYNKYVYSVGAPYSVSANHVITVTI